MLKRTGLTRAVVVPMIGVVFGVSGIVGESVAQVNMKKDDTMKTGDTMKKGDMKSNDMKKDGKAMMKDDKMVPGDKTMEKKQ